MLCREEQADYSEGSGESEAHRDGKKFVVEWLKNQGIASETEKWLPVIQRRADIYFNYDGQVYVVEIQLSFINNKDFKKRYEDYLSVGIIPFWVGMDVSGDLRSDQLMTLLDELLIRMKPFPHAYYIDLSKMNWLIRHSYYYLKNRTLSACDYIPENLLTIEEFLNLSVIQRGFFDYSEEFIQRWLLQTRRKRLQKTLSINKGERAVLQILQKHGVNLNHFPAICCVPLQHQYILKTPPEIWQTWILLDVIHCKAIDQRISITSLCNEVSRAIQIGIIQVRSNFMEDRGRIRPLITEFMDWLDELGVLMQVYPGIYVFEKRVTVNKKFETLLQDDQFISKRFFDYLGMRKK